MRDKGEPIWLDAPLALAIHDRQLAEHGGPLGVRDRGGLESALALPVNKWNYTKDAKDGEDARFDLAALAAAYAFGITRNHPFTDGNKRTAWVLARSFLLLNDQHIRFEREDAVEMVQSLAAGQLTETEVADWFRSRPVSS